MLCCAAGIKKYIVGLVIKLSSDADSAEVSSSVLLYDCAFASRGECLHGQVEN